MTDLRPSVALVEAVATEAGCHPVDLPPLYDTLDPDALDRLFPLRGDGEIVLHYHGYEVTLRDVDDITVDELDATSDRNELAAGVSN
ncbi:HalOD1 output domain-containing protein [Halomarina salina]|uniref:HalOD1 output domain-containing protein n=1 Tax=Halomarina salina TaxID=1872699 RepID=A0ABD5RSY0_9EURY|nr:HalOD1 output domain-containing protein [Halomarina salina]